MNVTDTIHCGRRGTDEMKATAGRLAALAHPARIAILQHLAAHEACCCKEVVERLDLAQSTVSQHLRVLVAAGLVQVRPEGQRSRYEVDRGEVAALADSVGRLLESCCPGLSRSLAE